MGKGNWEHGKGCVRVCACGKGRAGEERYRGKEGSSSRDVRSRKKRRTKGERKRGGAEQVDTAPRNILEYLRNLVAGH